MFASEARSEAQPSMAPWRARGSNRTGNATPHSAGERPDVLHRVPNAIELPLHGLDGPLLLRGLRAPHLALEHFALTGQHRERPANVVQHLAQLEIARLPRQGGR